jgi:hypothetical protein
MADLNKFENMLEKLVNEDRAGAEELFHEIVVEKSREIYENLLENDLEETDKEVDESDKDEDANESTDEEANESSDDDETNESDEDLDEATDEEVDESSDDEETKEGFDMNEFEVEPMPEADPADDMMSDLEMGDGEEGDDAPEGDEDLEDRMVDLEKELDDLRQQFNDEMGGGDDEGDDGEAGDMGDMAGDEEGDDDSEEESFDLGVEEATDEEVDEASDEDVEEAEKSETETMREYVEKVTASMGDNGANTKSTVAGANNMGGTSSNLVAGGEADSKGTTGGLAANSSKEDNMGNINVPGGKASKSMKAQPKGHGAEKKSAGETADNKKSTIGS